MAACIQTIVLKLLAGPDGRKPGGLRYVGVGQATALAAVLRGRTVASRVACATWA